MEFFISGRFRISDVIGLMGFMQNYFHTAPLTHANFSFFSPYVLSRTRQTFGFNQPQQIPSIFTPSPRDSNIPQIL
ncbi:unnamed protein product [Allacma fusca]|uniref:Uncharacterized protein n=1 Tax=Allacma fusca TaxID=39272 RepID=A0A8J2KIJ4_9HEXA|nr:unnamed protein product [Allacma fusca]